MDRARVMICFRRVARGFLVCALAASGAACASAPSTTERRAMTVDEERHVVRAPEGGVKVAFNAPRDSVWRAVVAAYGDLNLLPDVADTNTWQVARTRILMRRVYNGVRTSMLFSCGEDAQARPHADNGQITATARTQVSGSVTGRETQVSTLVDGYVVLDGGTAASPLHCGSNGEIETRIHKAIAARLGVRQPGS